MRATKAKTLIVENLDHLSGDERVRSPSHDNRIMKRISFNL